ncbi:MAG: cytochrome C oxidase Cbb3 [Ignavibacteria bacterium CG_4_8_14_3_um_filter_37_9]|nr:cytochrome-c oxidase, cbb3-type subunit I [Ignavibacteria bacterium]OIO16542.1 MAG: cytochrome C oxidase Cbb3 [Ignavibacteria bacterium CG1_02_37_35]PIP76254.1 MAG: cytochrome C oxidase Cbb3 [Ignavibacteria bacterium CG22_combo_CG10-13_8_21_14_all_37_15]PIW98456.1 MAG: cytochrome C oxidase Cbb3 [Ignavibacteria bacterium CG_4_8_14_3_um_filter_37_9]PIX94766.1 MAG: cytochrome C oxidase Cbb3 [Ignavibacteria bacterium CG_4_10_14_3_um_filter_37_18]PJC58424.1 MAG: cytochrome C oxidase Cbb3 [Ignavi
MQIETFKYDNRIVKYFTIATVLWSLVGMLVGLIIAIQLYVPALNLGIPYFTFSRIRPLHTNAVIFAFVGNGIFMGVYYSLQRLTKARMFSDLLSKIHFWGWQLIIVLAAITLPLGLSTSKEYAELEWPIDILITLIWVVFAINLFGTIAKRREKHLYVAIWFYIATIVTVAVLHIVNSIEIPVTLFKSYSAYAGVQDALVQWWYGHNAVAFFLTTPYLGLMYYFMPKAANRPIYSYRLSIIHFWALIFLYIWAGPHHLLYSALPDWAQSLGTVFSIMLIAPSWGGMINGLLTLRGAWDKLREDVVLKFMVVAITAYGMATFEGPMLSLKNVNALAHFTDWIIAHVHIGALGWNGFLTFGILYWLVPRLWNTTLYSKKLANFHFWIGFLGIVFYASSMYWSALVQTLMWKQFTPDGLLQYPNFLETVLQIIPMYVIRSIGGLLYLSGASVMVYNLIKTAKQGSFVADEEAQAPPMVKAPIKYKKGLGHRWIESRPFQFTILATVAILFGGLVEMIPTFLVKTNIPTIASVKPYTPLELQGRDLYIREGCVNCHSQLIRPFRSEVERYGEYSKAGEYVYDHPFLWGSKRTGPDLMREGKKYPNVWHYEHMNDPRVMSPGSIMPPFPWLSENVLDISTTAKKISVLRKLGVPYPVGFEERANDELRKQADSISLDLLNAGVPADGETEIIALIAYLQRLGTDIKAKKP